MTAEQFAEWIAYDPETGIFVAVQERRNIKGVGYPIGWTDDRGYIRFFLNRKLYLAHRVAWFLIRGRWPKEEIDHINGIRSDNRIINLREATALQNCYAKQKHRDGKAPFKGITKAKRRGVWRGRWQAQIGVDNQTYHLGYFSDPKKAAEAYDTAAIKLFGAFAKTNASLGLL